MTSGIEGLIRHGSGPQKTLRTSITHALSNLFGSLPHDLSPTDGHKKETRESHVRDDSKELDEGPFHKVLHQTEISYTFHY